MARVLVHEHALPVELREITEFPPPADYLAINPLGHVPVLEHRGQTRFPTRIVLDALLAEAPEDGPVARSVTRPGHEANDEQCLAVILTMGDALAAHHYAEWAGIGPVGRNRLGFDPAERNMVRVLATLDWLEARIGPDGFQPGVISMQDIALACLILWSESRGPIAWHGRPRIEALVGRMAARPSFAATVPRPHVLK